jgi:hypothetical protein
MGARRNLAESNGGKKPAVQSKFRCVIMKIGAELGFWKAALRITLSFAEPLEPLAPGRGAGGTFSPCQELW